MLTCSRPKQRPHCAMALTVQAETGFGTPMEVDGSEQLEAGDKCGRCGSARRDHLPGCSSHPKCLNFSDPKRKKLKKEVGPRPEIAVECPIVIVTIRRNPADFNGSTPASSSLKKTLSGRVIWNGLGRKRYQHLGLFLVAGHLSHPRKDAPSEHFQGETSGLSPGP
jgi:hypothetical protein